ncbi:5-methyltetrahydropteroyltriglutamate--homocysteine methyltransferase [Halovenus aranensis]|jgi:5-methyltetrahydropteroyltriglutamate--homocysteine methyltransferase|uniref:5-methyltetrahydropteroyltriglutamate--homocysteine methyltransferase n=1 Tax=Halovenus aranensis TaxID=890420 RepID=A0A1G8TGA4_9EURY|nr:5-methyltetrahydropteroyltriglutamate--homocysteine methyltransferase [Halovenus aranensis]SDJ40463.1 5-methyltetrahydropteroyltriglutamate--homocysteine methyltransferase [Halovenus aranensis]
MTQYVATSPGLYPLPDWSKEQLQDLKGNQREDLIDGTESQEIESVYAEVREELIARQQEAELDRIVEGQGRWDDFIAHPLAVHDSVETRGIVRYYNNNNFYREPVVTDELTFDGDVAAELDKASDHVGAGLQGVLPGPYSLADLATDDYYGDEDEFLAAIAEFLAGELDAFEGVETVFLLEPSLVENPFENDRGEQVSTAVDTVASATDADVVVFPYWGALEEHVYAHLLDADFEALGFDLIADHDSNVYNAQEYGTTDDVALGIVDGKNTLVEDAETVRERIEWFEGQTPSEEYGTVYATANVELSYLPVSKFEQKLDALGEATRQEVVA